MSGAMLNLSKEKEDISGEHKSLQTRIAIENVQLLVANFNQIPDIIMVQTDWDPSRYYMPKFDTDTKCILGCYVTKCLIAN